MSPQCFGTFIDLNKPCWRMSFKREVVLGRRTVCQDQMLLNVGINPALLHGWLMFSLWKHWGPCGISEVQRYRDNDSSGAIDFAVNWVHVANMCPVKNVCSDNTRNQQEFSLRQHHLTRLREKHSGGELYSSVYTTCVFSMQISIQIYSFWGRG